MERAFFGTRLRLGRVGSCGFNGQGRERRILGYAVHGDPVSEEAGDRLCDPDQSVSVSPLDGHTIASLAGDTFILFVTCEVLRALILVVPCFSCTSP
jgi:hypothetical protein